MELRLSQESIKVKRTLEVGGGVEYGGMAVEAVVVTYTYLLGEWSVASWRDITLHGRVIGASGKPTRRRRNTSITYLDWRDEPPALAWVWKAVEGFRPDAAPAWTPPRHLEV